MRGTHAELDPLRRGVIHALEQAEEDAARWCASLSEAQMFASPAGLPSVGFHMRHLVRSLDRLLCYAEDRALDTRQMEALHTEAVPGEAAGVWKEFRDGLMEAKRQVAAFDPAVYGEERGIGRKRLPTTVAGLLVHCAEHTGRHAGQMVTTAKLVSVVGG